MADKFETQIDEFIVNTEAKMLEVVKRSVDALIEEAQTPTVKGGKMRVDTGFLRSSGQAQLGSMPSGPSQRNPESKYMWETNQTQIVLGKLKKGDIFYFGWTAKYARYREMYDGFLDSAIQKWQSYVDQSVRKLRK